MRSIALALSMVALVSGSALAGDTPAPEGAEVYFITPQDGETLTSPVTVRFGLKGMGVAPAGTEKPKTGHHHLLIDTPMLSGDALNEAVPADDNHKHFGGGQTETQIELSPGTHSLQLLLADWSHIPHSSPVMSQKITITVK